MQIGVYDNLKSSGSAWLGDIPTHWGAQKLKFLATVQPSNVDKKTVEGEEPVILCNYTDVYKNEYIDSRLEFMQASATEEEIKKFKVDVGDVIVTKDSETPEDIAVPACVAEDIEGLVCGYHLTQIKPIDLHGCYLFRLFQSKGFNAQFTVAANGVTRFGLPQYAIANAFTPLPPFEEQLAIAQFLDFKTAQIDALIAKKQTLLDKLAEKRTALISHAVTKGLDSSAPMKDSGLAWLGEIPAHWKQAGLTKYIDSQVDYRGKTPEKTRDGVFLVTARNVKNGIIDYTLSQEYVAEDQYDKIMGRGAPRIGDVVFTTEAPLGEVANIDDTRIALAQRIIKFRGRENVLDNYFLKYWIMGALFQQNLYSLCTGSTALGIKASKLCLLRIALPPLEEQREIVKYLDAVIKDFSRQSGKVEQVIFRLQEYRAALITNAVTGKIDLRDYQIPRQSEQQESAHA